MTAINCLVWPTHAALFTDAATTIDGEINWIGDKVRCFPHLSAALCSTGDGFGTVAVQDYIGGASTSFDDMVDTMAASVQMVAEDYPSHGDRPNDFLAVGYSDRAKAFRAYQCSYTPGEKPVTRPAGKFSLQPGTPEIIRALKGIGLDPDALPDLPVEAAMRQMILSMEVQRDNAPAGCIIGGYQQMTVIAPDGILSRVVHRWPDRVTYCTDATALLPGLGG